MNFQILVSPPARVEPRHKDARLPGLHADKVALHSATMRVDALEDAVWMVPDGDGWAEVYGDGDGWPVWDVAMWAPAVSYGNGWVVPNGDGWSAYESHDS